MLGGAGNNMRGRPFGGGGGPGMGTSVTEDMMHQENDDSISRLSDRVRGLRELSIEIGDTLRDDNRLLDGMDNEFSQTGALLDSARNKIDGLVKSSSGSHMCYLAVFVVFVFITLYKVFHK